MFQSTLVMTKNHQEDLNHIRSMMERSSRFTLLSGLSGIAAGVTALVGAGYIYFRLKKMGIDYFTATKRYYDQDLVLEFFIVALLVLFTALFFGVYFTIRKSRNKQVPIWSSVTKNLIVNFSVPLVVGAVFCLSLYVHHLFAFIAPTTLIFYGLALVNSEKYTFTDVKYLGFFELLLGCLSLFFLGKGLVFWIIGFGFMHIIYGIILFKKHK